MTCAPVALRAEITKSIGPESAYLVTRLYLTDGTIPARLTREGWSVSEPR